MKLQVYQGTTSQRVMIFVQDSSKSTGAGLTGVAFNASGLTWSYCREDDGNQGATLITMVSGTRGTWSSGGWSEKDSTNAPGFYEIGIPNAVLAATNNAKWATMLLFGAANMAPVAIEIQLLAYNPMDASALGLTKIQNLPSGVKKNTAINNFPFLMVQSTDHLSPATGLTVTPTRSIDGQAFSACANTVSEVGNGWYQINLAASDTNGNSQVILRFTASGADTRAIPILLQ